MAVKYPANLNTARKRLDACESLIRQFIGHHNQVVPTMTKEQKYLYAHRPIQRGGNEFDKALLPLLQERNALRLVVRREYISDEDWHKLDMSERIILSEQLFGLKVEARERDTKATCTELDALKNFDLNSLRSIVPPDPVENFTTYTEVDTGEDLTVTVTRITGVNAVSNDAPRVYYDKAASHFTGDFEHLVTVYASDIDNAKYIGCWTLTSVERASLYQASLNNDGMAVAMYDDSYYIALQTFEGADGSDSYNGEPNTPYYLTIARASTTGTCKIYSDAARTALVDTLSITCPTTAYRYIYAWHMLYGADTNSGYVENLDLQEGGGPTDYPISISTAGLTISATIDRDVAWDRSITAGLTAAVTIAYKAAWDRAVSAGLTISATVARALAASRAVQAGLTVATSIIATLGGATNYLIEIAANLTASASVSRAVTYARALTPGLTVSATISRALAATRATSAGLTVSSTVARAAAYNRAVVSNLTASVTVARAVAYDRAVSAGLTVSATVARAVAYVKATSPGLTISTTVARAIAYGRAVSAGITVSTLITIITTGLTKPFRRIGDSIQGAARRIGDSTQGVSSRVGDSVQGAARRIGDSAQGVVRRIGDSIQGNARRYNS